MKYEDFVRKIYAQLLEEAIKYAKKDVSLESALYDLRCKYTNKGGTSNEVCRFAETLGCCGVMQIYYVDMYEPPTEALYLKLCAVINSASMAFKYYSPDSDIINQFKFLGFKASAPFYNQNSGNKVTELTYISSPQGNFKWPTLSDMGRVLGARAVMQAQATLTAQRTASPAKPTPPQKT